jgi:colanic acid biosynthesis glycosyl transferase WcaI
MRIAVHEMACYPFPRQLAAALVRRGHEVSYIYCPSFQSPVCSSLAAHREADGVTVLQVGLGSEFAKRNLLKRFAQERIYSAKAASAIARVRPDVVLSANCPVEVQELIRRGSQGAGAAFCLWLQDIYSIGIQSVLATRGLGIGRLVAERYALIERRLVRRSDAIVAIADEFRQLLVRWGVDQTRISVIENWAVLPSGALPPKTNGWARRHGLADKRVLLYSGALGFKHNPQLFLELAHEFDDTPDVRIVVISEGSGAEWLSTQRQRFANLVVLPFQREEEFREALAAADILVAALDPQAAKYSVPSKVLTYMTAKKPILAAIPADNLAARTLRASAGGVTVDPEDTAEFLRQARALITDEPRRALLGASAFAYARRTFGIDEIADRFEQFLCAAPMRGCASRSHGGESVAPASRWRSA